MLVEVGFDLGCDLGARGFELVVLVWRDGLDTEGSSSEAVLSFFF